MLPLANFCRKGGVLLGGMLLVCCSAAASAQENTDDSGLRVGVQIGFAGCWKLGHTVPLVVTAEGGEAAAGVAFQVIAPDGDGVPTVAESPVASSDGVIRWHGATRVGRVAPIEVRWTDGEQPLGGEVIETSRTPGARSRALAATDTLIVRVGASDERIEGLGDGRTVFTAIDTPINLPVHWSDYEAVDLLVIEAAAAEVWNDPAIGPRVDALIQWLRLGGRVLLSLGENADKLISEGAPLAALAPGKFIRTRTLRSATPLEQFADAERLLDGGFPVAQLENAAGVIKAHGPGRPRDLPLVLRTPVGLGEVLTVAFDIDSPALSSWPDRKRLLSRLAAGTLPGQRERDTAASGRIRKTSYELATAMRAGLGKSFAGVSVTPFLVIVAGTLIYLLLIGPGDWFFVSRVLKQTSLTWVTFPALAIVTVGLVYAAGSGERTGPVRGNQIELVDVDTITGTARGTLWADIYSPVGQRYTVGVHTRNPTGDLPLEPAGDTTLAWFGAPGAGLSGMQSNSLASSNAAYLLGRSRLVGLPIGAASTKSLTARWSFNAPGLIDADLTPDGDGLVEGTITNRTGTTLRKARLAYGEWAWRLGTLADGQAITIDEGLRTAKLTSLLRADLQTVSKPGGDRSRPLDVDTLDAIGLLKLMMYHEQLGGPVYSERELRYQRFVDLSHQLAAGRAVVLAELPGPRSQLVAPETREPLAEPSDRDVVLYRFVLPVRKGSDER